MNNRHFPASYETAVSDDPRFSIDVGHCAAGWFFRLELARMPATRHYRYWQYPAATRKEAIENGRRAVVKVLLCGHNY